MLEHFIAGFTINLLTSADDALTDIPVLSASAKTSRGRFAYALGKVAAVTLAILIAFGLSQILVTLPYSNYIIAGLVFVMAIVIYFDIFSIAVPRNLTQGIQKSAISTQRFFKLMTLGFFMTFTTMLDDMFALAPLFTGSWTESLLSVAGIYAATFILIIAVLFFSKQLYAVPRKRELATVALVIFGFLLLFGVV